ncbi:MAG: hypothetical protein RR636_13095 [Clostridium sp.]|uniref:hypothetical protein n=1 Tax=Clostridium sp. TaxID=1506 RepID=UPI0030650879
MIKNIPNVIYDRQGNEMRVAKTRRVFFEKYGKKGYVFHVEREEKITSISEFEITEEDGRYIVTRDLLGNTNGKYESLYGEL